MIRIISWILKPWRILMDFITLIFLIGVMGGVFTILNGYHMLTSGAVNQEEIVKPTVVRAISESVTTAIKKSNSENIISVENKA
ncbi:MAG: hypothetical protein Q4C70_07090, partial [Planctomycetia bacterium]|nr:hypothetical protein [Planctomycetia bacterium]